MLRMATSPASGRGEKKVSVRLGETLLRDRDAHLTLLGLHEIGKREHGAVSGPAQQSEDHEKADQARHRATRKGVSVKCSVFRRRKNATNQIKDPPYDGCRPKDRVGRHLPRAAAELAWCVWSRYIRPENEG